MVLFSSTIMIIALIIRFESNDRDIYLYFDKQEAYIHVQCRIVTELIYSDTSTFCLQLQPGLLHPDLPDPPGGDGAVLPADGEEAVGGEHYWGRHPQHGEE